MAITAPSVGDKATSAWADAVAGAINAPMLGDTNSGANVTLSTTSAFASTASVTINLAVQTRIRIYVQAIYIMASGTSARYVTRAAYNSGASAVIGSATTPGQGSSVTTTVTTGNGAPADHTEATVLLAAGQYTVYASVQRAFGGSATDTAGNFYVSATAVGFQ